MRPLLSVIVPVYNAAQVLPRLMQNFLQQTFKDFELIFVDDCSTDNSLYLCREYAAAYAWVHTVASVTNGGPSAARNIGMQAACGNWICFCDADDEPEPDFLSHFARHSSGEELVVQGFRVVRSATTPPYIGIRKRWRTALQVLPPKLLCSSAGGPCPERFGTKRSAATSSSAMR